MPSPLLCTHTSAKLPREARQATSPSSSTTTRCPTRASPHAVAAPTSPPPTTATSYSFASALSPCPLPGGERVLFSLSPPGRGLGRGGLPRSSAAMSSHQQAFEAVEAVEEDHDDNGDADDAGGD